MAKKFTKPESDPLLNPVDYFNLFGSFVSIFDGLKDFNVKSETEICGMLIIGDTETDQNKPTFKLNTKNNLVEVIRLNRFNIEPGSTISKFMLLTAARFNRDISGAWSYVLFTLMKCEIPYIRVGTDYFKIIKKQNRYKAINIILKSWDKSEINQDHGKQLVHFIPKFDDFTIEPNNIDYTPVVNNCYNLYAHFPHQKSMEDVYHENIPVTIGLIRHIFGEQWELGLKYMKLLYEHPKQILPVLVLVSTERETGKTTFLNYLQMLFGENSTLINPHDLMSSFNDGYATKNIIMIDETVIDKANTIEKLKSIATAKTISVSQKFVSHYSVPFFGKVIICTNKETDFMRIDEEEIRFWVRKIKPIDGPKNTRIEEDLFDEIPKFLKYLSMMPEIDFSKSRMVFTMDEIKTTSLISVKEESKSWLRKELEILIEDWFNNNPTRSEVEATAKDIKEFWFDRNNNVQIGYIRKVLKEEMKIPYSNGVKRYKSFDENVLTTKVGQAFKFVNNQHVESFSFEEVGDNPF
jgi:hypothetical protein